MTCDLCPTAWSAHGVQLDGSGQRPSVCRMAMRCGHSATSQETHWASGVKVPVWPPCGVPAFSEPGRAFFPLTGCPLAGQLSGEQDQFAWNVNIWVEGD